MVPEVEPRSEGVGSALGLGCGVAACSCCVAPWFDLSPFEAPVKSLACAVGLGLVGLVVPRWLKGRTTGSVADRVGFALCSLSLVGVVLSFAFVARFGVALD